MPKVAADADSNIGVFLLLRQAVNNRQADELSIKRPSHLSDCSAGVRQEPKGPQGMKGS